MYELFLTGLKIKLPSNYSLISHMYIRLKDVQLLLWYSNTWNYLTVCKKKKKKKRRAYVATGKYPLECVFVYNFVSLNIFAASLYFCVKMSVRLFSILCKVCILKH